MASRAPGPSVEDQDSLNVKNLSSELKLVADWHQLGIKLGLPPAQLRQIEKEHPGDIERCKVEVVDVWLQSTPGASWRHIVTALREMGDRTTAERIELKYVKGTRADSNQEEMSKAAVFASENRQAINEKFAVFQMNVRNKMLKNGVNTREFRFFVAALFPPGDCIPQSPTDLTEVFEAITLHGLWDSLHYSSLVRIVRNFGAGDPEMKTWIKKYKKDLKAYTIVASIEDCIDSDLDACTDQSRVDCVKYDPRYNCPVEWKTDFIDHSLQYLADVWEMFSDRYLLPDSPPTALLDRVRKGCVSVMWLVPSYLIPQLIERVKIDTEFFQKHRILKVAVRGEIVYEGEVDEESTEEPQRSYQKKTTVSTLRRGGGAEKGWPREKPKLSALKETFGGYDCEIVEYQKECPICHLILREPYLVTCCGTNFCHTCIQQLQADNSPCPTCREDNFEAFPNKGLNRSLKQLQVYCTQRKDGCQWRGGLGELDQHLNMECPLTLEKEEREDERSAEFAVKQEVAELRSQRQREKKNRTKFKVPPCTIKMMEFAEKRKNRFPEDLFRIRTWYSLSFYTHPRGYKMCLRVDTKGSGKGKGTHVSVFAYLMRGKFDNDLKWPFRGRVVIQLCNQLQDKYHHGYTIDFSETTDARVISRVTTIADRAKRGLSCPTFIPHEDLNFNPAINCQYLKNDCLEFQIIAVESLSEPGVLPTELTMTNFEQHKINSDHWYSPPFYIHPQGYKIRLRVDVNGEGEGKGAHVSVFAYLMQEGFDDVKWPYQGHVTVVLLNQLEDNNHLTKTITFRESKFTVKGERAPCGSGYDFIAHTELNYNSTKNCQYLKYDCLRFQIVKVEPRTVSTSIPTQLTTASTSSRTISTSTTV